MNTINEELNLNESDDESNNDEDYVLKWFLIFMDLIMYDMI